MIALMMPSKCFSTIFAARIIGSSLLLIAQPIHSFHARRVRSDEWINYLNSNLLDRFISFDKSSPPSTIQCTPCSSQSIREAHRRSGESCIDTCRGDGRLFDKSRSPRISCCISYSTDRHGTRQRLRPSLSALRGACQ